LKEEQLAANVARKAVLDAKGFSMEGGKPEHERKRCAYCKLFGHTVDECRKVAAKEAAAQKSGGAKPSKSGGDCWYCGESGHYADECTRKLEDQEKLRNHEEGAMIAVASVQETRGPLLARPVLSPVQRRISSPAYTMGATLEPALRMVLRPTAVAAYDPPRPAASKAKTQLEHMLIDSGMTRHMTPHRELLHDLCERPADEGGLLFDAQKTGNMYKLLGCAPVYTGVGTEHAYIDAVDGKKGARFRALSAGAGADGAGAGADTYDDDSGAWNGAGAYGDSDAWTRAGEGSGTGAGAGAYALGRAGPDLDLDPRQEDLHVDTFSSDGEGAVMAPPVPTEQEEPAPKATPAPGLAADAALHRSLLRERTPVVPYILADYSAAAKITELTTSRSRGDDSAHRDDGFRAGVDTPVPIALERESTLQERDKQRLEDHCWSAFSSDDEEPGGAPPEPAAHQEPGVAATPVMDRPRKARLLRQ
jgi:hypothetical protein